MKLCRGCQEQIDDVRFCPHCGRDQTVIFPTQDQIHTPTYVAPPAASPGAGQTVVRGMGYTFGGCLFIVTVIVLANIFLFVGCAALLSV